jgi:hypothetical protein
VFESKRESCREETDREDDCTIFPTRLRILEVHLRKEWWRLGESKVDEKRDRNPRSFGPQ